MLLPWVFIPKKIKGTVQRTFQTLYRWLQASEKVILKIKKAEGDLFSSPSSQFYCVLCISVCEMWNAVYLISSHLLRLLVICKVDHSKCSWWLWMMSRCLRQAIANAAKHSYFETFFFLSYSLLTFLMN